MESEAAIDAVGLTKSFGAVEVLRGVDVLAERGRIVALLGPNGAGKTTTVRILATLSRPDGGTARVAGADVVHQRSVVRRHIALTGQYAALDGAQTGRENLHMMARLARRSPAAARRRAAELLDRFELTGAGDRRVSTYSGGMRRRLDLAASLVADPDVIFLDEPSTGLDPHGRNEVWGVVSELARGGTTVLLTTQYLEEADRLADDILVLNGGRIVARGSADELKRRIGEHRLELVAVDRAAHEVLAAATGTRAARTDAATLTVTIAVADDAPAVRALLDDVDPHRMLVARFALHRASLDDVFLGLTRSPAPEASDV